MALINVQVVEGQELTEKQWDDLYHWVQVGVMSFKLRWPEIDVLVSSVSKAKPKESE